HTYAYHALSLSAIPPAIAEYKKLDASGVIREGSEHLKNELYKLADRHECVGDVRGIGHLWGFELVKNRKTKEAFNVKMDKLTGAPLMTGKVSAECFKNGLYVLAWYDNLVIAPPLIITKQEIDKAIHILDNALTIADNEVVSTGIAASRSSEFSS
ncbi:MAG: aminotransferase class III-fold pyridoxal phosphate-dependent enzyme, partial [Proteobacteria bacterium]|nr:aminotransferase class III-fold pyridoxal phosphate-dependent enzyme [Pseudomonadota bacterium]